MKSIFTIFGIASVCSFVNFANASPEDNFSTNFEFNMVVGTSVFDLNANSFKDYNIPMPYGFSSNNWKCIRKGTYQTDGGIFYTSSVECSNDGGKTIVSANLACKPTTVDSDSAKLALRSNNVLVVFSGHCSTVRKK